MKGDVGMITKAQWDSMSRTALKLVGTYLAAKGVDGDTLTLVGGLASIGAGVAWSWCEHSTKFKICGGSDGSNNPV